MNVPKRATDVRIHFFRTGQLNLCKVVSALILGEMIYQHTGFLGRWAHPNQLLPHLGQDSDWNVTVLLQYVAVHRLYLLVMFLNYCHSMKVGREQLVQILACHVVGIDTRTEEQWSGKRGTKAPSDTRIRSNRKMKLSSRTRGGSWEYFRNTAHENAW